jgi:hypothetical protein
MTKKMYASFMGDKIKTFGNIQLLYDSIVQDLQTDTPVFYRTHFRTGIKDLYPSTYSRFQKHIRKNKRFLVYDSIDKQKCISIHNVSYNKL